MEDQSCAFGLPNQILFVTGSLCFEKRLEKTCYRVGRFQTRFRGRGSRASAEDSPRPLSLLVSRILFMKVELLVAVSRIGIRQVIVALGMALDLA